MSSAIELCRNPLTLGQNTATSTPRFFHEPWEMSSLQLSSPFLAHPRRAIYYFFIHLFTCAYIGSFLHPASLPNPLPTSPPLSLLPSLPPVPPQFQAGPILPLSLILLKKRHKHNKEDKAFLLVVLRIAIYREIQGAI
jgi:hypothetical protein